MESDNIIPLCLEHHTQFDRHSLDILELLSLDEQVCLVREAGGIETATVRSLGLKRIGDVVVKEDRPEIRGMLFKVSHLVEVEEVSE